MIFNRVGRNGSPESQRLISSYKVPWSRILTFRILNPSTQVNNVPTTISFQVKEPLRFLSYSRGFFPGQDFPKFSRESDPPGSSLLPFGNHDPGLVSEVSSS